MIHIFSILSISTIQTAYKTTNNIDHVAVKIEAQNEDEATGIAIRLAKKLYPDADDTNVKLMKNPEFVVTRENFDSVTLSKT
jgi:hypothetical protein